MDEAARLKIELHKFIDDLNLAGESHVHYLMVVQMNLAADVEKLEKFLSDWDNGEIQPDMVDSYSMAEGMVEWKWENMDIEGS